MPRLFLSVIGLAYVALAGWCLARPAETARSVGFELSPGSGQSEYMVVYGGLQIAIGLLFLQPLVRPGLLLPMLEACILIHGCLVLLRTISLVRFEGIHSMTHYLAIVEWVIFLTAVILRWIARPDPMAG